MAARKKQGLTVKTFGGLNKKRMESKGGGANAGQRVVLKDGDTIPVQFFGDISTFTEFDIHQFQDDGRWHNVPCLGDGCPLCDDESDSKSKLKYRFCCPVYNLKEKKVQILEGPKDMAQKIAFRFEQKPKAFLKRPWEITRYPTNPTSYACDKGDEEDFVSMSGKKPILVSEYLTNEAKSYYGDEMPSTSSLDNSDDDIAEDDDAESWTREELEKKSIKQLKKIAADEGVSKKDIKDADDDEDELINLILGEDEDDDADDDLDDDDDDTDDDDDDDSDDEDDDEDDDDDDDDDDDEDDDDEDDDDEDDTPPAKSKKAAPAKKTPAKKAPAKGKRK